jgi:hypothetical protein
VPTVFSWNHGGKDVYLIGTFTEWKEKISMKSSHNDFTIIQNLPPGVYQYRYIVDGKWQTDPSAPTIVDPQGIVNNFIEVKEQKKEESIFGKKSTLLQLRMHYRFSCNFDWLATESSIQYSLSSPSSLSLKCNLKLGGVIGEYLYWNSIAIILN